MRQLSIYDQALNLLQFRARSVTELRRKLLQKGANATDVDEVIARLGDQKLLDDATFASEFARSRVLGAGASRRRIVQELRRKGVASDIADDAVAGLQESEGIDAAAAIHRVAQKKWNSLSKLDGFTRKRRVYAFLARRGFNPDEIRDALDRLGESLEP